MENVQRRKLDTTKLMKRLSETDLSKQQAMWDVLRQHVGRHQVVHWACLTTVGSQDKGVETTLPV